MSDFTDDEDRQLVQLALMFSRNRRQILWDRLTQHMKGTKKSKEALRQRLKTLKLNSHWLCHGIANPKTILEENKIVLTRGSYYKPQKYAGSKTAVGLEVNWTPSVTPLTEEASSTLQASPCFPKCEKAEPQAAAPASLLLLAYVATRNVRALRARTRVNS
ncbi:unnamed protein product [Peronospora destructor]|uniref:Myb-like domain-containing protein n=1 Tax=Peronospora destructor TaxID=86335 RepID=A0AAV0V530_9STRA|nr:unnamed protein product [Peronospora destructor]